jgi:hypothetical protein
MATGTKAYDNSLPTGNIYAVGSTYGRPITAISRVMDAAAIITAAGGTGLASATKITAGEEITAFTLPIGFYIMGVITYVKTAGTAGGTINIGTIVDTTAYDAAVSIATAGAWANSETDAQAVASGGALISSRALTADEVVVEYIADETTGVFIVTVFGIDFSDMLNL